jgi:hypothetical protein
MSPYMGPNARIYGHESSHMSLESHIRAHIWLSGDITDDFYLVESQ